MLKERAVLAKLSAANELRPIDNQLTFCGLCKTRQLTGTRSSLSAAGFDSADTQSRQPIQKNSIYALV